MAETHTQEYKGWLVTVWMSNLTRWNYVATKNSLYKSGQVTAVNRNEAVINALFDMGEGV